MWDACSLFPYFVTQDCVESAQRSFHARLRMAESEAWRQSTQSGRIALLECSRDHAHWSVMAL